MVARVRTAVEMFKGGIKGNGDIFVGLARSFVYSGRLGVFALLVPNGYLLDGSSRSVQSKEIGWTSIFLFHKLESVALSTRRTLKVSTASNTAWERCSVDRTAQDPSRATGRCSKVLGISDDGLQPCRHGMSFISIDGCSKGGG